MHPDTYHRTSNTVRTPLLIELTQSSLRYAIDNEKKKKKRYDKCERQIDSHLQNNCNYSIISSRAILGVYLLLLKISTNK